MEYVHYFKFARRWLWLGAVLAVGLGLAAGALSLGKSPQYESRITILVSQQRLNDRANQTIQDLVTSERRAITYSILLTKRSVMVGVIQNLGLKMDPSTLSSRISAKFLEKTELIDLSVRDTNPDRAAAIANEIIEVFNAQEAELLDNPYAATLPSLHAVESARRGNLVPSDLPRNVLLASVVGLLLAIAIGIVFEHFDDRIRRVDQIVEAIGVAPITTIGHIGGPSAGSHLIAVTKTESAVAEAFRMFRAHIDMARLDQPIRSLAVVSSDSAEGKSTIAANIAIALAQTSKRVILIDGNLRHPVLHTLFSVERGRGLADLLASDDASSATALLMPTMIENLRLLTSGDAVLNTTGLLGSDQLPKVFEHLSAAADLIVVDTPGLLGSVDSSLILQATDCAALIVRRGSTRASRLPQAFAHLGRLQVALLGVVLNDAPHWSLRASIGGRGGRGMRSMISAWGIARPPVSEHTSIAATITPSSEQRSVAE